MSCGPMPIVRGSGVCFEFVFPIPQLFFKEELREISRETLEAVCQLTGARKG
jgi:hypothetical protein